MLAEISETLGLNIQGQVSIGLCLKKFSYPSLILSLEHKEFPCCSLGLKTKTDFFTASVSKADFQKSQSQSREQRFTFNDIFIKHDIMLP